MSLGPKLYAELTSWLSNVEADKVQQDVYGEGASLEFPVKRCKAIIAPHAGYSYSGPAAAWAYKCIDTTGIKRVFILGPSHHVYLDGCALSMCDAYETPIGELPLDRETIAELQATNAFSEMSLSTDEDEHSIEMHLPYVRKVFEGIDIQIVPVLVGSIPKAKEQRFGSILASFLTREDTFTVVSSDFCHWGSRFNYTFYYPAPLPLPQDVLPLRLSSTTRPQADHPIYASITDLDHEGMAILRLPPETQAPAKKALAATHDRFTTYLGQTKNTICGRHPIGVLLGVLEELEAKDKFWGGAQAELSLKWVRYEQSSQCKTVRDSSVSYASAYLAF
ncbi:hypothetical protein FRB99_008976 [Tulasnella sp. 403]|nr:hypothetical protein FRB99_008976 [Tulasnella sp. 403]